MKPLLLFVLNCFGAAVLAQTPAKGLIFNPSNYDTLLMKPTFMRGIMDSLPLQASLKKYCPEVGNQGQHATCVGWAAGYAARTILWAKQNGIETKKNITKHAFSPDFIYKSVQPKTLSCDKGVEIPIVLEILRTTGIVNQTELVPCPVEISVDLVKKAEKHKIESFFTLFASSDPKEIKINEVKKSISEGNPVIIGMHAPPSFNALRDTVWKPNEPFDTTHQGHALCVIGYDDAQCGGKGGFELFNSWGETWGNQGCKWVCYDDFATWTPQAYELVPLFKGLLPSSETFKGSVQFVLKDKKRMDPILLPETDSLRAYQMLQSYPAKTAFHLVLRHETPTYVYAIATDNTQKTTILFPQKRFSPIMLQKGRLPTQNRPFTLDNTAGIDIFCLLYSRILLPIDTLVQQMEREKGSFLTRLQKVMGDKLVDPKDLKYTPNAIQFEATMNEKWVLPVLIKIPHQ